MNHQPCGLVYNHQRLILVDDIDRDVLGSKDVNRGRDQLNFDLIVFAEFVRRLGWLPVYEYVFILNQTLQSCSAPTLDL